MTVSGMRDWSKRSVLVVVDMVGCFGRGLFVWREMRKGDRCSLRENAGREAVGVASRRVAVGQEISCRLWTSRVANVLCSLQSSGSSFEIESLEWTTWLYCVVTPRCDPLLRGLVASLSCYRLEVNDNHLIVAD